MLQPPARARPLTALALEGLSKPVLRVQGALRRSNLPLLHSRGDQGSCPPLISLRPLSLSFCPDVRPFSHPLSELCLDAVAMFLLDAAKLQLRDGDVPPPPPPAPSPSPHARCAQSLSKCPCRVLVASLPPLPHPSPLTSLPQSFTACAGVSRVSCRLVSLESMVT